MSLLTGPEIRRLVEAVPAVNLRCGDVVWWEGAARVVTNVRVLVSGLLAITLVNRRGPVGAEVPPGEMMTRCGDRGERIVIEPFDAAKAGPASYDVHLGNTLKVYVTVTPWEAHIPIDPLDPPQSRPLDPVKGAWELHPGRVYLASTREYTETHGLAAQVTGRSSWGRYGLFIHVTAGFIDPGFAGHVTLELVATQPVIVRPGDKIAQIVYQTLHGEYQPYRGRYNHQPAEPVASRFHLPDGGAA